MADDLRGSMGVVLGLIFLKYLSPTPSRHAEPRVLAEWGEDAPEDLDEYTAENIFLGGARGPVDASEGPSQAVDRRPHRGRRHGCDRAPQPRALGRASPRLRPPRP